MTWKRAISGKLEMYVNGIKKLDRVVDGNQILDFKNSGGSAFDIGLRKDVGNTMHAYLSDLVIFNREIPEHELKEEWFLDHPLYSFI